MDIQDSPGSSGVFFIARRRHSMRKTHLSPVVGAIQAVHVLLKSALVCRRSGLPFGRTERVRGSVAKDVL